MGRGKVEIKKIDNDSNRQVTFFKRRTGLFKKAKELSILCQAEIAVIIFSHKGKVFEFSSSSMRNILSRYRKCLEWKRVPAGALPPKPMNLLPNKTDALKEEMEKLKSKQILLLGKDISGISLPELYTLEEQINEGLLCIKKRKEQILFQQLEESRMREHRIVQENQTLQKQIDEFGSHQRLNDNQTQLCIGYPPVEEGSKSMETGYQPQICINYPSSSYPTVVENSLSLETPNNSGVPDEQVNTLLVLGPPMGNHTNGKPHSGGAAHSGIFRDYFQPL